MSPDNRQPTQRRLRLRRADVCSICRSELPVRTEAWWDPTAKLVTCLVCGTGADMARDLAGIAGASGRAKYERLHTRREVKVKARYGNRIGRVVLSLSDDPQSTRAWDVGSVGEERLARFFERELSETVVTLHDRRIPGTRSNIDHIVVARNGVWVIDAKLYKGKVERRMRGPLGYQEPAVFVGGRDRTKVIHAMARQVEVVRAAIEADPLAVDVKVRPSVCFIASEWSFFAKPFEIDGVLVTWPQELVERIVAKGLLTQTAVERIANRIAVTLPPTTARTRAPRGR
jgi:hypothetical protein